MGSTKNKWKTQPKKTPPPTSPADKAPLPLHTATKVKTSMHKGGHSSANAKIPEADQYLLEAVQALFQVCETHLEPLIKPGKCLAL